MELAGTSDLADEEAVAFLAQVVQLEREVCDLGRQLDDLEAEFHQALNELGRARFEEYC
jgi:hypothetical protein